VSDGSKRRVFDIFFDAGNNASLGRLPPKNLRKITRNNKMRIFPGFLVK